MTSRVQYDPENLLPRLVNEMMINDFELKSAQSMGGKNLVNPIVKTDNQWDIQDTIGQYDSYAKWVVTYEPETLTPTYAQLQIQFTTSSGDPITFVPIVTSEGISHRKMWELFLLNNNYFSNTNIKIKAYVSTLTPGRLFFARTA